MRRFTDHARTISLHTGLNSNYSQQNGKQELTSKLRLGSTAQTRALIVHVKD